MNRLISYGTRISDNKRVKGSLVRCFISGEMRCFIKQDNSERFDEVYLWSIHDAVVIHNERSTACEGDK